MSQKEQPMDPEELAIEIWRLKKTVDKLESVSGSGTSVISLIIPPGEALSAMTTMLTNEYGTASNIKSRVNRLSVLSAITSAKYCLSLYQRTPKNGLVVYCGEVLEQGKPTKMNIHFSPYKPLSNFIYECNSRFNTAPLRELLTQDEAFGFIVMDGQCTVFGTVSGSNRRVLQKVYVDLPNKHGRGGQSAIRFARLREEARHNYVRKIAELSVVHFINQNTNKPTVEGLILAGSADFKNVLGQSDLFDPRLKAIILKSVDINYGDELGFNQAIDLSADVLRDVKLVKEQKIISVFLEQIAKDTKRFCYGLVDTLHCLDMSAIETLILWEDFACTRYEFMRPGASADEPEIVKIFTPEQAADPKNFVDSETGKPLTIKSKESVAEWLVYNYKKYGISLEFVSNKSAEGQQFVSGFGGIGAILRWAVDTSQINQMIAANIEEDEDLSDIDDFI